MLCTQICSRATSEIVQADATVTELRETSDLTFDCLEHDTSRANHASRVKKGKSNLTQIKKARYLIGFRAQAIHLLQ